MFDKALFRLPGMHGALAALVASALLQAVLVIGQTLALASCIAALWADVQIESQIAALAAFLACFAIRRALSFAQDELLDAYAQRSAADLRSRVLDVLFSGRADVAASQGTAASALAATEHIDLVETYARIMPPKICGIAAAFPALLAALFVIDPVSGVIVVVALPVIIMFMVMLGKQARARAEAQFNLSQGLANRFVDALRGIQTLASLGAVERARDSVFDASESMRTSTVRTLSVATLSSAVLDLITVLAIAAVAMMLAFRLMDGSMQLCAALCALMLASEAFVPVRSFAGNFHSSLDGRNALGSVLGIIENAEAKTVCMVERELGEWASRSEFRATGICYGYETGERALADVSFECRGFSNVGIVGESGAGKSTLVNILAGFAPPSKGTVSIDGEPCDLRADSWTSQCHYIPQHPHLFAGSLGDNIRLYAPAASDEDVLRAVRAVGLDALVAELPDGLQTPIGEGARQLSGGQAQRVALARALLGNRRVLLFDEPTAHLDVETELDLKERMLPLMRDKLVFFATHRLHWLADMDYVIVLEGGRVAEAGRPKDLLRRDGALSKLAVESQKGADA